MRELKVNKKLKKKIVGYGYKNTREWTQAKIKRIIFIDIFAAIPEVAALIALVDSLFSNDDDIILIVTGVWCSTALIPLCVAIIYYKIIRNNSSVSYEMYKEEQLFYDDEGFTFSFTDYGGVPGNWTYQIKYKEIEDLIDYPNISMIRACEKTRVFSFVLLLIVIIIAILHKKGYSSPYPIRMIL